MSDLHIYKHPELSLKVELNECNLPLSSFHHKILQTLDSNFSSNGVNQVEGNNNCSLEIDNIIVFFKENFLKYLEYSGLKTLSCLEKSLEREVNFIFTVILFLDKVIKEKPNERTLLLFDIDETIGVKNSEDEDFFRPAFFYIVNIIKIKYGDTIDFGILSSRGDLNKDFENTKGLGKISGYLNPEYLFSCREEACLLDSGNEEYKSGGIMFPEAYNQKVNGLNRIKKQKLFKGNIILVDDIIEGGVLEELGEGISVRDSLFLL